ncbi:MAG TPA: peptidyl-prolyl cis-trans isomerase, partial [Candidatus Polarisedimenticolia bacterium]|nr:peptidyl-prolyl cis-trans isomerase [Candidatus Polarisedimenticolia bacterium]
VLMGERRGTGKPGPNDNHPMTTSRLQLAALLALLSLGIAAKAPTHRRPAASTKPPAIATIGDRRVDEADIRRAAVVMERDPIRASQRAAWRRKLLDLCVDRELLALEAERQGLLSDERVLRTIDRASADLLFDEIRTRYLLAEITPTQTQIDTARAGGLFRRVKIAMILSLTDKAATYKLLEEARHGARFDSLAANFSVLPSAQKGGEVGWKYVGELNAGSWREFQTAKPGDLMGPYVNGDAHELYRVESVVDPDDKEIRERMMRDRVVYLEPHYQIELLKKYHFRMNPDGVSPAIFAAATERSDSILASLDEKGFRAKNGTRPALGTLATVDGDSISYRDLAVTPGVLFPAADGKAHIDDSHDLLVACTGAVLPRLVARDAHERGLDREPAIARRLRLIREEVSTRAMVARAVPALDSVAVRAYFDAHASAFQRPPARRAFVAVFAAEDTARAALAVWSRASSRDSIYKVEGFRKIPNPTANTLFQRGYAEVSLLDTDTDPVSQAVRGLKEGEIAPLIPTPNGYAVARALGREPARAYRFEEVRLRAATEARELKENAWVENRLERLRAATPARTVPARLEALQLGVAAETTGGSRR